MSRLHVVAILDTMWGSEPGEAAPWFRINPNNHSGRRLYKLVGPEAFLLITNACRELVTHASQHGTPDPEWLAANLRRMQVQRPIDVLLVCGKVAQGTYKRVFAANGRITHATVIEMPHPAARSGWTRDYIAQLQAEIAKVRVEVEAAL